MGSVLNSVWFPGSRLGTRCLGGSASGSVVSLWPGGASQIVRSQAGAWEREKFVGLKRQKNDLPAPLVSFRAFGDQNQFVDRGTNRQTLSDYD